MAVISYELFYWKNGTIMFCSDSCSKRIPSRSLVVSQVFRGADYDSGDNLGRRGRLYWILGLRKTANFEGTLL